jgi:hypothetical protein
MARLTAFSLNRNRKRTRLVSQRPNLPTRSDVCGSPARAVHSPTKF